MSKKNNNKMNMYLLKACVHQLNRETRKSSEIYAVMEVIREVIESLENQS